MALAHRRNFWNQHTKFPVGKTSVTLPNEIIKSYLPALWSLKGRWAQTEGILDLEELGLVRGHSCRTALLVILKALRTSETSFGVANELKRQLDNAADQALRTPSPEHAMSKIFENVAWLIRKTGQHPEMAYATSEWFSRFAARHELDMESMFSYVIALDQLRATMTGPLRSLLRQEPLTRADIRIMCRHLRQKSSRELIRLWNEQNKNVRPRPRRSIHPSAERLVPGGALRLRDIERRYREDPDSIIVRLGRKHRASRNDFEIDDDYSTDTDTSDDDDDEYCPYAYGFPRVRDPSSFHPLPGLPHAPPRLCGPPPFMVPPGRCIPPLLEAGPLPLRPQFGRFHSSYPI
ncbi:MAG: hypothetical protein L6R42_003813 [Xanthoria sp. 1 TBL-2021]|nr:MAG: hypothetical protein L6R42_003813 [Xanthoria sp. 1 TBL-2021]